MQVNSTTLPCCAQSHTLFLLAMPFFPSVTTTPLNAPPTDLLFLCVASRGVVIDSAAPPRHAHLLHVCAKEVPPTTKGGVSYVCALCSNAIAMHACVRPPQARRRQQSRGSEIETEFDCPFTRLPDIMRSVLYTTAFHGPFWMGGGRI